MNGPARKRIQGVLGTLAVVVVMATASAGAEEPKDRPFLLGFTNTNFDATEEGTRRLNGFLKEHAEVVSLYLETGVPWPEAFESKPFHEAVRKEIAEHKKRIGPRHKVFLALNAINFARNGLADYWGKSASLPRPDKWADKSFDDPDVIKAFVNYSLRMVEEFKPAYLAYAIEINMLPMKKKEEFDKFLVLARQVHAKLKAEHPEMMVFATIQLEFYHGTRKQYEERLLALLPFCDAVAVSTYPYTIGHTPKTIPAGWITDLTKLAPGKSFVVSETGFPGEHYKGDWLKKPIELKATPEMQRDYVQWLLTEASQNDAKFVNWFFAEDIDAEWARQGEGGKAFVSRWRDTGLVDETFKPRLALGTWDRWLALPVRKKASP